MACGQIPKQVLDVDSFYTSFFFLSLKIYISTTPHSLLYLKIHSSWLGSNITAPCFTIWVPAALSWLPNYHGNHHQKPKVVVLRCPVFQDISHIISARRCCRKCWLLWEQKQVGVSVGTHGHASREIIIMLNVRVFPPFSEVLVFTRTLVPRFPFPTRYSIVNNTHAEVKHLLIPTDLQCLFSFQIIKFTGGSIMIITLLLLRCRF